MNAQVKALLSQVRRQSGGQLSRLVPVWLWQRMLPEAILCPCYHLISDQPVPHVKHYEILGTAEFEQDLDYLEKNFQYARYEQILDHRAEAGERGTTSVCLTFDDGFAECYSVVRPILLRRGATCIFFIVTDLVDNGAVFFETRIALCVEAILQRPTDQIETLIRELGLQAQLREAEHSFRNAVPAQMARHWMAFDERVRPLVILLLMAQPDNTALLDQLCQRLDVDADRYVRTQRPYLSSDQIRQLRADGFTIGAHSCSHHRLQSLSREEAEREIVQSCSIVRDLTGQASVPFAFPYFGQGLDRQWLAGIRERHPFIGLFFDTQGLRRDHPLVVQRVFAERIEAAGSLDRLLRRAWLRKLL